MRKIFFILFAVCISCSGQKAKKSLIITSKSIGDFKLGDTLIGDYNKDEFDIKISKEKGIISEILVKSKKI